MRSTIGRAIVFGLQYSGNAIHINTRPSMSNPLVKSNHKEIAMEKMTRDVALTISVDAEQKDAKAGYSINVRFVFDPANLTDKDIIELLFDSSSLRVKFANHHRPKGAEHLAELAKQPFVEWIVKRSGTRQPAELTPTQKLMNAVGPERAMKLIEKFDTAQIVLDKMADKIGLVEVLSYLMEQNETND